MGGETITLKALVDKERNRIIYVESDADFVDILFSFLTMPLGTIIRLTRNHPPVTELGCISNLYASVENLDAKFLRTKTCKTMLLHPQNAAADHCKNLMLQIDDTDSAVRYFMCSKNKVNKYHPKCRLLSNFKNSSCHCGCPMGYEIKLYGISKKKKNVVRQLGFVYEVTRFVISDELEVQPISSAFIFSLLDKHGLADSSMVEERSFEIGVNEVLSLLKFSMLSRCALTETLLQQTSTREASTQVFGQAGFVKCEAQEEAPNQNGKISVRLYISKSKRIVCYAEGDQDFADLLFSFLTFPLGYVFKETCGTCSRGCFKSLYESVQDLDSKKSLLSEAKKDVLLSPKLANWHSFSGQLLCLEELGRENLEYFWGYSSLKGCHLATNKLDFSSEYASYQFSLMNPKSPCYKSTSRGEGFVRKPGMFTVTDDLMVTPISSMPGLSILKNLKVPYSDIEERTVLVGKEEALGLLVAAFNGSSCALTQVFLPKPEVESAKYLTSFF